MKKNLKKIAVCLLSTIIVQTCCFMPLVSAAVTVDIDVNWNNQAIGKTYETKRDAVVSAGGTGEVRIRGNSDANSNSIAVVAADPTDSSGENKALMLNTSITSSTSIGLNHGISRTAGLQVASMKVMWTGKSGTCEWHLNSTNKVYIVPGDENIAVKNNAKSETYCTLNYNKWNEFTYVFDVKLTADNKWDTDNTTCTAYVNGQKLFTDTFTNLKADVTYGGLLFFTCNKGTDNGALVYFDDVTRYYNLSDTSKFEIKNYDAMNNSVYMAGTTLKLQAESMIGEDYGAPFDKVEWYCEDVLIGTGNSTNYIATVGDHTICAKAYIGEELKKTSGNLKISVEPGFTEAVLMDEDFEAYTDGTSSWTETGSSNTWNAPANAKAVTVDAFHDKSIDIGLDSGRKVNAGLTISNGIVKISGEYYFASSTNIYDTLMLGLNNGNKDINHLSLRGSSLYDGTNNATLGLGDKFDPDVKLEMQRWYKVDLVLTFKDGQGYYNIYLDGKRLTRNAYAFGNYTSVARTNKVTFLSSYNTTAPIYLDNLKISMISYNESTAFYDGTTEVDTLSEVEGNTLTAKTLSAGGADCRQYLAIYDKATNRLLNVVQGTFNNATSIFTATCDISAYDDVYAKVFLWNEMTPVNTPGVIR